MKHISSGFSPLLLFPAKTGKLNSTRYGTRTRTIGAYCSYCHAKFSTCSSKGETVSDSPDSEAVGRSFRMLIEHIRKKRVSANVNIKLRPLGFPAVFS